MKKAWITALFIALQTTGAFMQAPATAPAQEKPKMELPRGQMPDLGRPTKKDDALPVFNAEIYFVGKWNFEWDVPETPLGPAGRVTGTEVYKPGVDGRFYESTIEGTDADGKPFKKTAVLNYVPSAKAFSRLETGPGYQMLSAGPIGGDLGGYYTIYYESAPFQIKGHTVRMKTTTKLLSPVNYKVTATVSIDGGPFISYGNPWWRKEVPGVTTK